VEPVYAFPLPAHGRQPINQRRHGVVRNMVEKLARRIDSFLAGRAAGYNDTFSAFRERRRFIYEMSEVVSVNFVLNGCEENGFLHGTSAFLRVKFKNKTLRGR
jgi:hypothetical protein